jgi:hypothetical protein
MTGKTRELKGIVVAHQQETQGPTLSLHFTAPVSESEYLVIPVGTEVTITIPDHTKPDLFEQCWVDDIVDCAEGPRFVKILSIEPENDVIRVTNGHHLQVWQREKFNRAFRFVRPAASACYEDTEGTIFYAQRSSGAKLFAIYQHDCANPTGCFFETYETLESALDALHGQAVECRWKRVG